MSTGKHRIQGAGAKKIAKRGEVNWLSILRKGFRDVFLLGFGAWIIWKQVYAPIPDRYLAAIGFGMMVPAAGTAFIRILLETGSSSSSSPSPAESPSPKSTGGIGE